MTPVKDDMEGEVLLTPRDPVAAVQAGAARSLANLGFVNLMSGSKDLSQPEKHIGSFTVLSAQLDARSEALVLKSNRVLLRTAAETDTPKPKSQQRGPWWKECGYYEQPSKEFAVSLAPHGGEARPSALADRLLHGQVVAGELAEEKQKEESWDSDEEEAAADVACADVSDSEDEFTKAQPRSTSSFVAKGPSIRKMPSSVEALRWTKRGLLTMREKHRQLFSSGSMEKLKPGDPVSKTIFSEEGAPKEAECKSEG